MNTGILNVLSFSTDLQDWTWSVGAHPFSSTSAGWNVAGFHNDAMARSYIVTAFDESVRVVNSAVEILANERTRILYSELCLYFAVVGSNVFHLLPSAD